MVYCIFDEDLKLKLLLICGSYCMDMLRETQKWICNINFSLGSVEI